MQSTIQKIDFKERFGYEYIPGIKPEIHTALKENCLFSYIDTSENENYCECAGFYKINDGSVGIHMHYLNGTGSGSTPEKFIKSVRIFGSLQQMQEEVKLKKSTH